MQECVAVLDLKHLTDAHPDDARSVNTSALVDRDRLGRDRRLRKRALEFYKDIGQTTVDICDDGFLDNSFACVDPGTHRIDAHPDDWITGQLSAEMNMPLDCSGIALCSSQTGLAARRQDDSEQITRER